MESLQSLVSENTWNQKIISGDLLVVLSQQVTISLFHFPIRTGSLRVCVCRLCKMILKAMLLSFSAFGPPFPRNSEIGNILIIIRELYQINISSLMYLVLGQNILFCLIVFESYNILFWSSSYSYIFDIITCESDTKTLSFAVVSAETSEGSCSVAWSCSKLSCFWYCVLGGFMLIWI